MNCRDATNVKRVKGGRGRDRDKDQKGLDTNLYKDTGLLKTQTERTDGRTRAEGGGGEIKCVSKWWMDGCGPAW